MSSSDAKQYGLILPSKNKTKGGEVLGSRKLNPLLDSDDELEQDEESPLNWVEASLKKSAGNSGQQSLQKRLLREALEEDASVFQYDEVYEDLQAAKTAQASSKQPTAKKPKYIHNIIKQAEKRKLEGERRTERKVQRERDAEGDEFADKESFVTASYLKKMEELKKVEEEARLEELREEKTDVMQHKNFGVFYNHLFRQRVGEVTVKEEPKSGSEDGKEEENQKKKDNNGEDILRNREDNRRPKHYRTQRDLSESPERQERGRNHATHHNSPSSSDIEAEEKVESYRDRREKYKAAERNTESERGKAKGRHQPSPERKRERSRDRRHRRERSPEPERSHRGRRRSSSRDRRRRLTRSRSPTSRRGGGGDRRGRQRSTPPRRSKSPKKPLIKEEKASPDNKNSKGTIDNRTDDRPKKDGSKGDRATKDVKVKKEEEQEKRQERQDRIHKLFTKRTVGEKFTEAVQRYYQRKAEREAQG